MNASIHEMITAHKNGQAVGLFSVCSTHPVVIESSVKFAAEKDIPVLIEATCNQVNQFGGYTGLVPGQFAKQVSELVAKFRLSRDRLLLGGDHIGPYPRGEHVILRLRNIEVRFESPKYAKFTPFQE